MRKVGKSAEGLLRLVCLINGEMPMGRYGPFLCLWALPLCLLVLQQPSCFHHGPDLDDEWNEDGRAKRWGEPGTG